MRSQKFSLLLLTALAAVVPSIANAGEPYVGVSVGATLPENSSNTGTTTAAIPASPSFGAIAADTPIGWETEYKTGFDLNLHGGYRMNNGFRVELQGYYNENPVDLHRELTVGGANIDGVNSAILTRATADPAGPTVGEVLSTDTGKVKSYGVMANAFYDFNKAGALQPYVGGGAGLSVTDVQFQPSGVNVANDSKTVFAWQGMAGITYKIGPAMEIYGQYTYRDADKARVNLDLLPAELGVDNKQSIVQLGLRVPLGGK